MDDLCDANLMAIFPFVDGRSLVELSRTCSRFRWLADQITDPLYWRQALLLSFPSCFEGQDELPLSMCTKKTCLRCAAKTVYIDQLNSQVICVGQLNLPVNQSSPFHTPTRLFILFDTICTPILLPLLALALLILLTKFVSDESVNISLVFVPAYLIIFVCVPVAITVACCFRSCMMFSGRRFSDHSPNFIANYHKPFTCSQLVCLSHALHVSLISHMFRGRDRKFFPLYFSLFSISMLLIAVYTVLVHLHCANTLCLPFSVSGAPFSLACLCMCVQYSLNALCLSTQWAERT